jgi:signal transduction histidine kinase
VRLRSLSTRVEAAVLVVAAVVAVAFVVTIATTLSLRRTTTRETHSKDVVAATLEAQTLVVDFETGIRGYVISHNQQFLQPWRQARQAWPSAITRLRTLVANDHEETQRAATIASLVSSYQTDYAYPVIYIARIAPSEAIAQIASDEAKQRVDAIRAQLTRILDVEARRSRERAASARTLQRDALAAATVGLAASALLVLLFGAWIGRAVVRPIQNVTESAAAVAAGDLSTRLDERGPGEIGVLKQAFNSMTRALEASRLELVEQNERLRASEEAKSDLISMISHELRTPLSSVLGFTTLLLQRDFPPEERRHYLEIVDTEARRLAALAEDFLDVRLLEEGRLELEVRPVDLVELVRRQTQLFFAHERTHELVLDVPDQRVVVTADSDRIAQVVANLLSNAIKYSPDGCQVHVALRRRPGWIRISVSDEGVGIPREHQERIFEKFFRGGAPAAGIPGTGLGLAVTRRIVEAHGGTIAFTSEEGTGSTFWVDLPLEPARARAGDLSPQPPAATPTHRLDRAAG